MEGFEFQIYFQHVPLILPHFLGVYSIDTMPRRMPVPSFYITNLSKAETAGTHWIAVTKPRKGHLEIFDSLGFRSDLILPFLNMREKIQLEYNVTQLQLYAHSLGNHTMVRVLLEKVFYTMQEK